MLHARPICVPMRQRHLALSVGSWGYRQNGISEQKLPVRLSRDFFIAKAANDPAYRADVLPPMTNFPSRNLVVAPGPSPYRLIRYEPPYKFTR